MPGHGLAGAFFHAGTWSSFRRRVHGRPVDRARTPGYRFIAYLQDHDQIGNRAVGDRLSATLAAGLLKVGAVLLLTSPFTPMLFMGEEWAAATPWQFFTSHPGAGAGRGRAAGAGGPSSPRTAGPSRTCRIRRIRRRSRRSKLDWSEVDAPSMPTCCGSTGV